MWPEPEPDRKPRGPPPVPWPQPELFADWGGSAQKASVCALPLARLEKHPLSCHLMERGPAILVESAGDVSHRSGVQLGPLSFRTPPEVVPASGDHVQFMCVFNFASSSVVAGPRPCPPLPLWEELREELVCLWEPKRTRDVLPRGPPPPPKQPCSCHCSRDEGHASHIC